MAKAEDHVWMQRCLDLAARAEGQTAPNPLVGCVVLDKEGNLVGEGFHPRAGESHAEVFALDQAGEAARGGTLYCSLEPCCHQGRTPPCSLKVIASGVKRVVVGLGDPNPKVDGGGLKALREAGIEVIVGVLEEECRYQNRGFLKAITQNRPWLALKMAVTLDGKIADRDGHSQWISGPQSREVVMTLRKDVDAILVGGGTARLDNPSLTVRIAGEDSDLNFAQKPPKIPVRVVLDRNLTLADEAKIFAPGGRTIVFCSPGALAERNAADSSGRAKITDSANVELIAVDINIDIDIAGGGAERERLDLRAALEKLKDRGINRVLCEGGAHLAGALLDLDLVDEVYWFVAPKIMADQQSLPAVSSMRPRAVGDLTNLQVVEQRLLGDDVMIHALIHKP